MYAEAYSRPKIAPETLILPEGIQWQSDVALAMRHRQ